MDAIPYLRLFGWFASALVVLVLGTSWALDTARAGSVRLEVEMRPSTLPADGVSAARLTVRVTNANGSPRAGDTVEVLALGAGSLDRFRALTDLRGEAEFVFTAARGNKYRPAAPVTFRVTDTSLGRLVEVNKTAEAILNVVDPPPMGDPSGPSN